MAAKLAMAIYWLYFAASRENWLKSNAMKYNENENMKQTVAVGINIRRLAQPAKWRRRDVRRSGGGVIGWQCVKGVYLRRLQ